MLSVSWTMQLKPFLWAPATCASEKAHDILQSQHVKSMWWDVILMGSHVKSMLSDVTIMWSHVKLMWRRVILAHVKEIFVWEVIFKIGKLILCCIFNYIEYGNKSKIARQWQMVLMASNLTSSSSILALYFDSSACNFAKNLSMTSTNLIWAAWWLPSLSFSRWSNLVIQCTMNGGKEAVCSMLASPRRCVSRCSASERDDAPVKLKRYTE